MQQLLKKRNLPAVLLAFALILLSFEQQANAQNVDRSIRQLCNLTVSLLSWKGDYLHRPDTPQGVTTWDTGRGNQWTIECLGGKKIALKSWKGDYLHRPDTAQGVTTWDTGTGNQWTVESLGNDKIQLKSWKGDYLHRPDTAEGVTTWHTGIGNQWRITVVISLSVLP